MDSAAGDVEAGLRAADAWWSDVSAIVLTHWHNDHAAGAMESQRRSGAPTYCGAAEVPYVQRATRRPGFVGALGDRWPERGPLVLAKGILTNAPRHPVEHPTVIGDGERIGRLEVLATPGHTPGHISVWDPDRRIVFTGDALAVVDDTLRRMSRPVTLDCDDARTSMLRLLDLDPEVICPGHRNAIHVGPDELALAREAVTTTRWPLFG